MTASSEFPQIFRVRQKFDSTRLDDVPGEVLKQLAALKLVEKVRPGQSVAITAGSRGIANIATITRTIVEHFISLGAKPFIVPAMGSHGGATAEGQRQVIESYGISESFVGCPIRSSMETVVLGHDIKGFPLHFDSLAYRADHIVVCNRIKPHTDFQGDIESGLMKMLLIGLGKREGARIYHRAMLDYGYDHVLQKTSERVLDACPVLAGVAAVENALDETAAIAAYKPSDFASREKELLVLARKLMPRLPFEIADILLIDRVGKEISGMGFDPNVAGRKFNDHKVQDKEFPRIKRICLRALTAASHGNAIGMGLAEFCRTQLLRNADLQVTRLNSLTSGYVSAAMPPLDYETDREMLGTALSAIGLTEPPDAKFLWIADTLHLQEVECSRVFLDDARKRDDLEILTELRDLPFDAEGNLPDLSLNGTVPFSLTRKSGQSPLIR